MKRVTILLTCALWLVTFATPASAQIAADVSCGGATNGTTSQSCTLTGVSASATAAFVAVTGALTDVITGCTVGGNAMTLVDKCTSANSNDCVTGGGRYVYLFYKVSPGSGSLTVTCSASSSVYVGVAAATYTGSSTTTQPEATGKAAGVTPLTGSATVVTTNAWLIAAGSNVSADIAGGTGTTLRRGDGFGSSGISGLLDSNTALSSGSHSLVTAGTAGNGSGIVVASLAPGGGGPATPGCKNGLVLLGAGCDQ
jgi:hypothetical protein